MARNDPVAVATVRSPIRGTSSTRLPGLGIRCAVLVLSDTSVAVCRSRPPRDRRRRPPHGRVRRSSFVRHGSPPTSGARRVSDVVLHLDDDFKLVADNNRDGSLRTRAPTHSRGTAPRRSSPAHGGRSWSSNASSVLNRADFSRIMRAPLAASHTRPGRQDPRCGVPRSPVGGPHKGRELHRTPHPRCPRCRATGVRYVPNSDITDLVDEHWRVERTDH